MEERITGIETILNEIRDRLGKIESKTEKIERKITEQNRTIIKMEELIQSFGQVKEEMNQMRIKNSELMKRISAMEKNEDYKEKKIVRNKVEIIGIPKAQTENVLDIIKQIADETALKVSGEDIVSCYRERDKAGKEGCIIAEFKSTRLRDNLLKEVKKKRLKLKHLKQIPGERNVYVNEVITRRTKEVYYHAKKLVQEKRWSKIWIYAGIVFIKQEAEGNQIKIESMEELEILRN